MRNAVLIFCLICLGLQSAKAHREQVYYLMGTIGEEEVGLQLDETGDDCMARYFTFDNRFDRIFEGKILGGDWFELFAYSWAEKKPDDRELDYLVLKEVKTDIWKGTFRKVDGTELDVNLVRINIDLLGHPYAGVIKKYNISPYFALKTRDITFKFSEIERFGKHAEIQKVVEPVTRVEWFRIVPGNREAEQVDSINGWLTADQISYVAMRFSIPLELDTGSYKVRYDIKFLNSRLLSYKVYFRSVSFSRLTEEETILHTLAVSSARQLMLEDLFWFGAYPRPQLTEGEYKWTQYRYKAFGPKVYELLQHLYPRKFSPKNEGECKYSDQRIWYFPEWYLRKEGLTLISKAPLASSVCTEVPTCIVPYRKLKPYMVDQKYFSERN